MADESPPPREVLRAGYETRDLSPALVVMAAVILVLGGVVLHLALWQVSALAVPEQNAPGASPPVVMPGESPVNDRIRAVPRPRLDPLEPLTADPPSYRSSRPVPGGASPTQRPEDLCADRQPLLTSPAWVEKGKVARIPISTAMDAVVESERAKAAAKKGGGK
jgi:hypothetical protein